MFSQFQSRAHALMIVGRRLVDAEQPVEQSAQLGDAFAPGDPAFGKVDR